MGDKEINCGASASSLSGKWLGHRMVELLFDFARRQGYRTVRLHTSSDLQGAIAFYEKLGFRRIEKYRDVKYSDVFMEREL